MELLRCLEYVALMGVAGFVLGRVLPKDWFDSRAFPYAAFPFERGGKLYDKIQIKKWQNRLPDMSKILPFLMPPKRMTAKMDANTLRRMLQETCVAEFIHWLLFLGGFGLCRLLPWPWGLILALVYNLLGNLPFILIQRYNRPRLQRLYDRMEGSAQRPGERRPVTCQS